MAEAVTRDMASSDLLKLAAHCLFPAQSVSKNKSTCDCAGARTESDRSTLLSNSLLWVLHVESVNAHPVASWTKFETGQNFEPATTNISFVP